MASHPLTVHVPEALYQRLKRRAEAARHSVEAELLAVVATGLPTAETLPPDLSDLLDQMTLLDDDALWQAARHHLDVEVAARLEALNLQAQREGKLDVTEQAERDQLVRQYEQAMLVRAQAIRLLHERGHDVRPLGPRL